MLTSRKEYLGDWVNLMGHQKAAFEVLTQLFTAQSVMQTPAGRVALMWYSRFDVFIGLMGSFEPSLSREWFSAPVEYYESRAAVEHRQPVCSRGFVPAATVCLDNPDERIPLDCAHARQPGCCEAYRRSPGGFGGARLCDLPDLRVGGILATQSCG